MYVWLYGQIYIYSILRKPKIERTLLLGGSERYLKKEYIRVNPQSNEELKFGTALKFWSHGELKLDHVNQINIQQWPDNNICSAI